MHCWIWLRVFGIRASMETSWKGEVGAGPAFNAEQRQVKRRNLIEDLVFYPESGASAVPTQTENPWYRIDTGESQRKIRYLARLDRLQVHLLGSYT